MILPLMGIWHGFRSPPPNQAMSFRNALFTVGPLLETFMYKLSFWTNADELSVYFDLHQSRHSDSIRQGLVPNNSLPIRLTMQFVKDLVIVVFSNFSFDMSHPIVNHNFSDISMKILINVHLL